MMDMNGKIYYAYNSHVQRPVASISKIMTAIIAVESGKLDEIVTVGEEINKSYGSGIYIKVGEEISLRDLIYGLMLRSGNDAALAIAHFVGGDVDTFIKMMNDKAAELEMKNSAFNNPHGLDDDGGNYSTAYDMAILTKYANQNEEYRKIAGTKNHKVETNMNYYSWTNKHRLVVNYDYITGGKTGFTDVARRTLVTTASKDGIELIVVTLNNGNDFKDHISLVNEVFNNYTNHIILASGTVNILGEDFYTKNRLYTKNDISYVLSNKDNNILLNFKLERKRGFSDGDQVGIVELYINGEKKLEENIYVGTIEETRVSFWERIINWFRNI